MTIIFCIIRKNGEFMKDEKIYEYLNNKIIKLNEKYEESKKIIHENEIEITELKNELGNLNYHISNLNKKTRGEFLRKILKKLFSNNSKLNMAINLIFHMLFHPIRAISLVSSIKKFNYHNGDNYLDILYLNNGKININNAEKPMVSIIIPVYNQIEYTYKCLKSIENNTKDVSYEVIIADDVSIDGTRVLNEYVNGIKIVKNTQNMGFLKNCNNAASNAKGKYILFLNNDTQVTDKWLSSLVELIESDKTIGMVGSKLVYPDGRLQEAGGIIFNNGTGCNYGKFDDPDRPQYNYIRDVDYISGASIMISNRLWKEIGGFDLRYAPAYCEDSDLAFEVRNHGYRVVYQPKSVVVHYEGISNGTDVNSTSGLKHYQVANNKKLLEKWKKELEKLPEPTMDRTNFAFRDRIDGKRVILVVDHYVPEFDKDAGSRTTYQYLKMFVNKGYIVKFLPDNFHYSEPYTNCLEQMGIEVLYGMWYKDNIDNWILWNKDNIDIVYLNRPHITIKYIDFIKDNTSIKIIYYGHDLHFLREEREYEITKDESHLHESKKWKEIELSIMKKADVVYYPSYVEEEYIKKIDPSIPVKAINAYMFDKVDDKEAFDFEEKKGMLFVGGFIHRPNLDAVKWFSEKIYPIIKQKKHIPFYIVGSNPPTSITKLSGDGITVKGYVTDEKLDELYKKCRLIVAPLRYGAGIKGKIIEAMKMGIPVVTTSCGAEGIKNTNNLLIVADNEEEFAKEILKIYDDYSRLQEISHNERKYINDNYTSEAAYEIIKSDFKNTSDYLIVTPDGFGSKGDEAMIKGVINVLGNDSKIKLLTVRKNTWLDKLNVKSNNISEEVVKLSNFDNYEPLEKKLIILGADLIDGTCGLEESLARLDLAIKFANSDKPVYIYCSFRSDVNQRIIDKINNLPKGIKIYLRDELSIENFKKQVDYEYSYFPDFAYFCEPENTERSMEIKSDLEIAKLFSPCLIGLNFSETSFRSFNNDLSIEKRKEYVEKTIEIIIKEIKNPYLVLISHDTRNWKEHYSDTDFQKIAANYLKEIGYSRYKIISENLSFSEILSFVSVLDTVITGRMHFSVSALKNNLIPIVYTGNTHENNYLMIDKVKGMLINRIGDDSYAVSTPEELKNILKIFNDKKVPVEKLMKKIHEVNIEDQKEYIKMKNILTSKEGR